MVHSCQIQFPVFFLSMQVGPTCHPKPTSPNPHHGQIQIKISALSAPGRACRRPPLDELAAPAPGQARRARTCSNSSALAPCQSRRGRACRRLRCLKPTPSPPGDLACAGAGLFGPWLELVGSSDNARAAPTMWTPVPPQHRTRAPRARLLHPDHACAAPSSRRAWRSPPCVYLGRRSSGPAPGGARHSG
jgi:hypothetical protein